MNKDFFTSPSNAGVLKLEITADDLQRIMRHVVRETANSFLVKMEEERSSPFISKEEAMKMLKGTSILKMYSWELRKYLNPFREGEQIFYLENEVLFLKNFAELLIVKPLKMNINFFDDSFEKLRDFVE